MSELLIGYRAVFYGGEVKFANDKIRETYDQAVKDIEMEHESIEEYNSKHFNTINSWTHAQIEKVYYRH